jgi:hypothetical protein
MQTGKPIIKSLHYDIDDNLLIAGYEKGANPQAFAVGISPEQEVVFYEMYSGEMTHSSYVGFISKDNRTTHIVGIENNSNSDPTFFLQNLMK